MSGEITHVTASGEEIYKVIEALEPHLTGFPRHHVMIACLSIAAGIMDEDLEPEDIVEIVNKISQFMSLQIAAGAEFPMAGHILMKKEVMN